MPRGTTVSLMLILTFATPSRGGLHYSGETFAELPSQWRGFLVDVRQLRLLAVPRADGSATLLREQYLQAAQALQRQAEKTPLSADDAADLGALWLRLGQPEAALAVLRPAQQRHPTHFRLVSNLGTAWQMLGDLEQAARTLEQAVALAPQRWKPFEQAQAHLVRLRARESRPREAIDDFWGVRYFDAHGRSLLGSIPASERDKLPANALAVLQQLALWLPADGRLVWQIAELANALGDVRTAANLLEGCVSEWGMTGPILRQRRTQLRQAAEALGRTTTPSDAHRQQHDSHRGIAAKSPRPLVRKFDVRQLPPIRADQSNPLPWLLLTETTLDPAFRPKFPEHVEQLDGKRIQITGFMQPIDETLELSRFLLIEYPIGCWFCETPDPTGIVLVELPSGHSVELRRGLVQIEGVLRLNRREPEDFLYTIREAKIGVVD